MIAVHCFRLGCCTAGLVALALMSGCVAGPGTDPVETASIAPDTSAQPISGSQAVDRAIVRHARENDLPVPLAFGVVRVESGYNPGAIGSGVYGLSQIKPATARSLGFSGSARDLLDPDTNLKYGMKYLKGAWERGDRSVCRTAMKYKGGHRATHMSASTLSYCERVKRVMNTVAERRPDLAAAMAATPVAVPAPEATPADEPAARAERPRMVERREAER